MDQKHKYNIKVRVWIDDNEGAFLGHGRIKLLENIKTTGSITNASKQMGMSYRKAWELVKKMNANPEKPLVSKIIGGKNGSGAQLTEEGEKAIELFYTIENDINNYIKGKYNNVEL